MPLIPRPLDHFGFDDVAVRHRHALIVPPVYAQEPRGAASVAYTCPHQLDWSAFMLPATSKRVQVNTPDRINAKIRDQTERNVRYFAEHPEQIDRRLKELDEEWDIERLLEANAASFGFAGVVLGAFVDRRFLVLPALVTGFLFQHALQGWCPPVPLFRARGVRTASEIGEERVALKFLRGDFAKETTRTGDGASSQATAAVRSARA